MLTHFLQSSQSRINLSFEISILSIQGMDKILEYVDNSLEMSTLKIFILSLGNSLSISIQLIMLAIITIGVFWFSMCHI